MTSTPRKKIAILGGGASSLTTAYALTSQPDWRDRFESITVYQMGWRLGGKGASGRGRGGRIEEHGLHIWMGWYANAFRMIRDIYDELGRPPSMPLATWTDAFKPHSYICLGEQVNDEWTTWPVAFPQTSDLPGEGKDEGEFPSVWAVVHEVISGLHELLRGDLVTPPPPEIAGHGLPALIRRVIGDITRGPTVVHEAVEIVECELLLREARERAARLRANPSRHTTEDASAVIDAMHGSRDRLLKHLEERIERDDEARRLFFIMDTGLTCIAGILAEVPHVSAHAFDALDKYDLREFMAKHGADPRTVQSAIIRAFYDLLFAYVDGDPNNQQVAAGVAVRFIFHMGLAYRGAVFWKMQAGMGDTIFAPIYDVLKRRGVRFEFFHRVRSLELSDDKRRVARIQLGKQATLNVPEYEPFVNVNELPCWPNAPRYEQLMEGAELERLQIDLESLWTPWRERESPVTLEDGRDYDVIVFGISLAGIPYVAPELVKASPRWQAMLDNIATVRTQAMQLWLKRDLAGLGWSLPSAVTDAYPEPMDTWADMSHLILREDWTDTAPPENITYFCAPMTGGIPAESDRDAPARELERVKRAGVDWLNRYAGIMWPKAMVAGTPGGFDWSLLVDPDHQQGVARFNSQYCHANIDPSERYVLSVPGSTQYRLHADDPDFDNVFITGDWTYSGVNAGCVEGTVMSGLLTASAMTGYPSKADIVGWNSP